MQWKSFMAITGSLAFAPVNIAQPGSIMELNITENGNPSVQRVLIGSGKINIKQAGGEDVDFVFASANKTITIIEHGPKRYSHMDENSVNDFAAKAGNVMTQIQAQLSEQLANMPEDQRKQVAEMMENLGLYTEQTATAEPVKTIDTGLNQSVNGAVCRLHKSLKGEKVVAEICMSQPGEIHLPEADYNTLRAAMTFAQNIAGKAANIIAAQGISMPGFTNAELDGVPVYVKDHENNVTMILKNIQQADLASDVFQVPEGYRQQQLPTLQ